MTDMESVKNAQRLHHILQSVQRIHRSVGELSYEMFMADGERFSFFVRLPSDDTDRKNDICFWT